jgi:hypothetical protein
MQIIQANPYHLVDVLFLLKECIKDMNSRGLKQWNNAYPGPDLIKDDIEKGSLFLYIELGMVKGMVNLSNDMPKEYSEIGWKGNGQKVLYVNLLAVHPLWLDTDISDNLLNFAEQYARENKYTCIRLDVLDSYPVNEQFFLTRDFKSAGDFHTEFQKMPFVCFEKNL